MHLLTAGSPTERVRLFCARDLCCSGLMISWNAVLPSSAICRKLLSLLHARTSSVERYYPPVCLSWLHSSRVNCCTLSTAAAAASAELAAAAGVQHTPARFSAVNPASSAPPTGCFPASNADPPRWPRADGGASVQGLPRPPAVRCCCSWAHCRGRLRLATQRRRRRWR